MVSDGLSSVTAGPLETGPGGGVWSISCASSRLLCWFENEIRMRSSYHELLRAAEPPSLTSCVKVPG